MELEKAVPDGPATQPFAPQSEPSPPLSGSAGYPAQQPGYPQFYPAQQQGYPAQQQGYPAQQQGYPAQQQGYPPQQPAVPQMTHCPDGTPLATPWIRLGAYLLDGLFGFLVTLVVLLVFGLVFGLVAFAVSNGVSGGSDSFGAAGGVIVLLYMLGLGLSLAYWVWAFVLRVRTHGASPGKQVLGLRIRTFHADGQLTNGQVWGRVGLPALASTVSMGVSPIVDYVWLLWDRHVQCLHDKAVGTVVVNTRLPVAPPEHPGVQLARSFPAARGWVADGPVPPGTTTSSYRG